MVDFAIIEIAIFVVSVPFILYFATSSLMFRSLAASAVVSFALEVVNELVFAAQGTYYPKSLIFMPFFKFPVAIVFLSVLYAGIINITALKISGLFLNRYLSIISFFIAVLILNSASIYVESAGIHSGYWAHSNPESVSMIQKHIYLFYLAVVLPGSIFIAADFLKKFKKTDQHF
jgi:hypothetical protein